MSWVSYRYDFWANVYVIVLMKLKQTKIHTLAFKRDPVRQGHVTLNVTFLISDSSDARGMIFFFVSQGFWGRRCQINITPHCNYQARPCMSSHVTLSVTFPNSGSSDARAMIFFLFRRFLGSQMSNKYNSTL